MYKLLLEDINSIHIWAIAGLILFMLVFIGSVIYSLSLSKQFSRQMSQLPLDEFETEAGGEDNV